MRNGQGFRDFIGWYTMIAADKLLYSIGIHVHVGPEWSDAQSR